MPQRRLLPLPDNSPVEIIIKYNGNITQLREQLSNESSVTAVEDLGQGFAVVTLSDDTVGFLYEITAIEDIELPKELYINNLNNMISTCIVTAQSENGYGLSGEGVIVGIIDTGIDYTHPDFRTPDGLTRILSFWDQSGSGNPPDGFTFGREYTSGELNAALASPDPIAVTGQLDIKGHGTAVAGIAAGGGISDPYQIGVAPKADIIAVRVLPAGNDYSRSTELMRALKYVTDKARSFAKPVAINISYGMNEGAHLGDSLFEEYITAMSNLWKTSIIIPTGNEGGSGHHYYGTISSGETKNIEFFTASGLNRFYISLWKNFTDNISAELILPDGATTGIITQENRVRTLNTRELSINMIYNQPTRYSVSQEIFFDIKATEGNFVKAGVWIIRLRAEAIVDGKFNIWLPTVEEVTTGTYFSAPDNFGTLTIPSTSAKVIRVAGYNDSLDSAAEFSGRGFENLALPIPDITAPAVGISAPRIGGGYDSYTGTSFAAPFATGTAALMMETGIVRGNAPYMYGERIKAYLRRGAIRTDGVKYPNPTSGYGRLCAAASIAEILK